MPSFSGEVQAHLLLLILLTSAVSILKADHLCTHLSTSEAYLFAAEDTYDIQQLFLEGFRTNRVNAYNLRRFGFTGDGGVEQCIIVNYIFQCDNSTGEACSDVFNRTCGEKTNNVEAIEWSFLWTTFDTSNEIGRILLNLAIYDLRVFGFELCDVYKDPVTITLVINSSDPTIYFSSCDHICIGLLEFTKLLPGLSGGPSLQHPNSVPEAIGYAASWNATENYLNKEDTYVTLFSIGMVASTKLFILAFCYETLQQIHKHRISHKTNKWFYRYWGAQPLIIVTLILVIHFDKLNQKNKSALHYFYISLGLDVLCCIIIVSLWVPIRLCIRALISRVRRYQFNKLTDRNPEHRAISTPLVTLPGEIATQFPEETRATIHILNFSFPSDVIIGVHNQAPQQQYRTIPRKKMIQLTDITKIQLQAETKINLPSKTTIKLKSHITGVSLKKFNPSDNGTNTLNHLEANTEIILSRMTGIELVSETTMTFSSGKVTMEVTNNTSITLPKETQINLPLVKPIYISEDKKISLPECTATFTIPTIASKILDRSVPPPLTLMYECCGCCSHCENCSGCNCCFPCNCGTWWKTSWTFITNLLSLILFLAFSSYLSQALPAITISYYLNPTASFIRLGFYEVIIVVMLLEISYLLFLLDKCTWLCYFNKYKEIPEEIKNDVEDGDDDAQEMDKKKSYICKYIHEGELIGCKETCGCNCACNCTHRCWKCDCTWRFHWLYMTTLFQILIMIFIIGLSAALLYFLLRVVIQQTSSPNNQFKDILAIVPTIALNLWLLSRHVDIGKALKDIAHKAHEYTHDSHGHDPSPA